jgi:tRNA (guanine10-N2)-dimethyltransferase
MQNITQNKSLYFYTINYPVFETQLCKMEMKYLFDIIPEEKSFFSSNHVAPSRSAFIKYCLSVMHTTDSLEDMAQWVLASELYYDDFKLRYIDLEDKSIPYKERRRIESVVGFNIQGEADVHNPKTLLGIANVDEKWYFGMLEENQSEWNVHNIKPHSYSNALNVRVARTLVNIAAGNNLKLKMVDPCCGVGTVVIEALSMGIDIKGFELNPYIAENAKRNLEHFGYGAVVTHGSMHDVTDKFDAAVVDLPYGVFSPTTLEEQLAIISSTRRLADKAVFITFEDMDEHFKSAGFKVIDKCQTNKGKFIRYITICN